MLNFKALKGAFIGAVILILLSLVQKIYAGFDIIAAKGYVIPLIFGGLSGYLIFIYILQLKESEKQKTKLATVVEQATQVIIITDLSGNIEYVNPAFEKTTGYTHAEAKGQNPRVLKSGEQDTEFYNELWNAITSNKSWQGIFSNKRKDGTLYYERAIIFPVLDAQGKVTNYAAVKQDITKERNLEQQLQQAQKMESIGTLAGGVAHDFNNLLTVINGYSDISLVSLNENDKLYKNIFEIKNAAKRAENLTQQLLAFSRKQIYNAEILSVNQVISDMDKMLRRLIGEDIHIETVLVDNLQNIKADKTQLEQIFVNLVINARDAIRSVVSDTFEQKITIETGQVYLDDEYVVEHPGSKTGQHIFFAVSDNGTGMDEVTKRRIFEPFFTTKSKFKGTGLGLSMVYGIVKQNNGSVYVYSEPCQGTMFKIYWPVTTDKIKTTKPIEFDENIYGSETILIVEDDKNVRTFACDALSSLGYQIVNAANGRLALELVENENIKFDLVITDLIMPELNGKEFVEKVHKKIPNAKVIYVSGYTDNHIVHNGLLEKDINFIHKPYSVQILASKVRQVLDNG